MIKLITGFETTDLNFFYQKYAMLVNFEYDFC